MDIQAVLMDRANLSVREGQILALICEGMTDKGIARHLAISLGTVHAHIEHLYLKMGVQSESINVRCAAISNAVLRGMVTLSWRRNA